ncbi:MAG: tetratricopeptide repeat protein, partial [Isosphaeraceae bacterium]|nr:tetratricopeptide repeat protein [Isosphaeraceae bacterium]
MDRKKRPARLLGLVCILPLAVTGCRTIVPTKPAAAPNAPPSQENAARPSGANDNMGSIVKTDFHRKATPDQQFNVHLELGKQQMREGQFESALGEFRKALDATTHASGLRTGSHRTEQQALAHRKIGSALGMMGKFTEAEEQLKLAAKLTPNDPRVWNDLGYTYYSQSRWADAERCLRRASKLDPDSPLVQTNLGLAVADDGRTADALDLLSHSSGKAVGHANLGFALASQGRLVEARDEYRKALELQSQLAIAQQALAKLDNPKGSEPLVNAPPVQPRLAPGVPNAGATVLAMPATAPLPQPSAVYNASMTPTQPPMAAERPSDPAVSEVRLVSPAVPGAAQTTPAGAAPANQNAPAAPSSSTRTTSVTAPPEVQLTPTAVPGTTPATLSPATPDVQSAPTVPPSTTLTAPATV